MDVNAFLDGFALVVEPKNLLYCLIGVLIGMIIGVLPGLGRRPPSRSCCPSPTASTRCRRSSCSPASTTAHSTAAPSPRSCCACPVRHRRWSPSSTASPWPSRAKRGQRSASRRSARSWARPSRSSGSLCWPGGRRLRLGLRSTGVRRPGVAGCAAGRHDRQRKQAQGADRRGRRPAAGHRGAGQLQRRLPLHLREPAARRRHRLRRRGDGFVRCRGDPVQPRGTARQTARAGQGRQCVAVPKGPQAVLGSDRPWFGDRLRARRTARWRRGALLHRGLRRGKAPL